MPEINATRPQPQITAKKPESPAQKPGNSPDRTQQPAGAPPQSRPNPAPNTQNSGQPITGGLDSKTQFLATQNIQNAKNTGSPNADTGTVQPADAESKQLADSVKIDVPTNDPKYGQVKNAVQGIANDPDGKKLLSNAVQNNLSIDLGEHDGAIAFTQGQKISLGDQAFKQGDGYLTEVLGHELTHQVSGNDGDTQNEEALASTLGRRIRSRFEGKGTPSPEEEAADYRNGVQSAKGNDAYTNLPNDTSIFDTLANLGIDFDPVVRNATADGSKPSGSDGSSDNKGTTGNGNPPVRRNTDQPNSNSSGDSAPPPSHGSSQPTGGGSGGGAPTGGGGGGGAPIGGGGGTPTAGDGSASGVPDDQDENGLTAAQLNTTGPADAVSDEEIAQAANGDPEIIALLKKMDQDPEGHKALRLALDKGTTYKRGELEGNVVGLTESGGGKGPVITLESMTLDTAAHETAHAAYPEMSHAEVYRLGHRVEERGGQAA